MPHIVPAGAVATYLELALAGQQRRAVHYLRDLQQEATSTTSLITELLAPAQDEVGRRWHRGELSTADEHLVTGVSQTCLESLASGSNHLDGRGLVLVASAEGDWHSLASHMFAELLRDAGRGVLYLGPSTPAEDVAAFIQRRRPEAVTVTCSIALSFLGTSRIADAAHAHGVPVLAGGRALDAHRATYLGADGWASDSRAAVRVLDQWRRQRPQVSTAPLPPDPVARELHALARGIGDRAFALLTGGPGQVADDPGQRQRITDELVDIVRFVAAARLVDDPRVFDDFRRWLQELLAARGAPEGAVHARFAAVAPLIAEVDEPAAEMVRCS